MRKLNKEQLDARDALQLRLVEAHAALEAAVNAYNEIIDEATTWRDDICTAIDDYVDARSEKWAESDAAQSYDEWKSTFEDLCLDPVEAPEAVSLADISEAVGQ